jgi:hypothetical protein
MRQSPRLLVLMQMTHNHMQYNFTFHTKNVTRSHLCIVAGPQQVGEETDSHLGHCQQPLQRHRRLLHSKQQLAMLHILVILRGAGAALGSCGC